MCDRTAQKVSTRVQKATLFCPSCGHASPIDGDWVIERTGGEEVYSCPDCAEQLTTRPLRVPLCC
ncbi:hypothetical protein [Natronobiforma cellulositropha]|uniref:hypothetical protein n=1 Tax=Natronobiforma cellulositropha TaxID=1679076 RepID=UPI0021D5977E|nr:hypothetical protein [Natronobiforma cellulositropha]